MSEQTATAFAEWLIEQGVERAYERPLPEPGQWAVDCFKDGRIVYTVYDVVTRKTEKVEG